MKYNNYPDKKIRLLKTFSHTDNVRECFFKNSESALCCDRDGYIIEYDVADPQSIPTPTIFNKSTLNELYSCMQTMDKKYIIAASGQKFYILDATDGIVKRIHYYSNVEGWNSKQIAKIRPNILITAEFSTHALHDITNIQSIPRSLRLSFDTDGAYVAVIRLESNAGDFAIGGRSSSTELGFVSIKHLGKDNQTITMLKYVDNIPGEDCDIQVIKEMIKGTILYAGDDDCTVICSWNYLSLPAPQLQPLCWLTQVGYNFYDLVGGPY